MKMFKKIFLKTYCLALLITTANAHAQKSNNTGVPPERFYNNIKTPKLSAGDVFTDCEQCPEMVIIPFGSFMMGAPKTEDRTSRVSSKEWEARSKNQEVPVHKVIIKKSFAVGMYPITFAQWDACYAAGGCSHNPPADDQGRNRQPVQNVSWADTQEYTKWLSVVTGEKYRLLSEAEWEYSARAGSTTRYNTGALISHSDANIDGAKGTDKWHTTSPVGSFPPNKFGLYDTHGNIWERVDDCWNPNYLGAPTDGSVWTEGDCENRVLRGGSWHDSFGGVRSATRFSIYSTGRGANFGFRVARDLINK